MSSRSARQTYAAEALGRDRIQSEDSYFYLDEIGLYLIADGSSQGQGKWASSTACHLISQEILARRDLIEAYNRNPQPDARHAIGNHLYLAVQHVAALIHEEALRDRAKVLSLTTLDGVLVLIDSALTVHAGNSRIYLRRDRKMHLLTEDDTTYQQMLRAGSSRYQLNKNLRKDLVNALGLGSSVQVQMKVVATAPGDSFILSTDGFHEFVAPESINYEEVEDQAQHNAQDPNPAKVLVRQAIEKSATDNVTVLWTRDAASPTHATQLIPRTPGEYPPERATMAALPASMPKVPTQDEMNDLPALDWERTRPPLSRVLQEVELVRQIPIFRQLGQDEARLLHVHRLFRLQSVPAKQTLFAEGDPSDSIYIIVRGSVEIVSGNQKVAELNQAGEVIGEMGVFAQAPRSAGVVTQTPCELIYVRRDELEDAMAQDTTLALMIYRGVIEVLANRLNADKKPLQITAS